MDGYVSGVPAVYSPGLIDTLHAADIQKLISLLLQYVKQHKAPEYSRDLQDRARIIHWDKQRPDIGPREQTL
jgi:hypothetical protein